MGKGVEIKWNRDALYRLRSDPSVIADLESRAARIAAAAGEGFETSSQQGAMQPQGRWRTTVITATAQAQRENARNDTLYRALQAGS